MASKRKTKKSADDRVRRILRGVFRWTAIAFTAFIVLSFLAVLPLRWIDPPTTSFMLRDSSGRDPLLHEWVDWDRLGTAMPLAVVASEDQRFADHFGFDVGQIRKSIDKAQRGGRLRGASTITQQLVKNLYLSSSRSMLRKGLEAWLTIVTELCLPKRRILELYVNIAELGPGIYGVGAAGRYYFGKTPEGLSDADAALLAATLPNPVRLRADAPTAYVRERQAWILGQMRRLRREDWLRRIDD